MMSVEPIQKTLHVNYDKIVRVLIKHFINNLKIYQINYSSSSADGWGNLEIAEECISRKFHEFIRYLNNSKAYKENCEKILQNFESKYSLLVVPSECACLFGIHSPSVKSAKPTPENTWIADKRVLMSTNDFKLCTNQYLNVNRTFNKSFINVPLFESKEAKGPSMYKFNFSEPSSRYVLPILFLLSVNLQEFFLFDLFFTYVVSAHDPAAEENMKALIKFEHGQELGNVILKILTTIFVFNEQYDETADVSSRQKFDEYIHFSKDRIPSQPSQIAYVDYVDGIDFI